jgi:hypothetical protein
MEQKTMTDLELLDKICENLHFIHPLLYNDACRRGIAYLLEFLPYDKNEAKAIVRARLAAAGKYVEDEEIQQVQQCVNRMNFLQKQLSGANMADVHKTLPILEELSELSTRLKNYYK